MKKPTRLVPQFASMPRRLSRFAQQPRSNSALRTHTNHHTPALLLWCNGLLREGSWWALWWGSLDGMQGVRGSNPLSSTTTTAQVIASPLIQRRFFPPPGCPIRATRVPLGAGDGVSARADAASISSSRAAAMAASRPAPVSHQLSRSSLGLRALNGARDLDDVVRTPRRWGGSTRRFRWQRGRRGCWWSTGSSQGADYDYGKDSTTNAIPPRPAWPGRLRWWLLPMCHCESGHGPWALLFLPWRVPLHEPADRRRGEGRSRYLVSLGRGCDNPADNARTDDQHELPRALRALANTGGQRGRASPSGQLGAVAARWEHRRSRRPCHPRAISSGHERYVADSHGHSEEAVGLGAGSLTWGGGGGRNCMACKGSRLTTIPGRSALITPYQVILKM